MAIVLELLSRKNMPLKHYKFDQDYVCVGRDFNNDLRLDDPYVCPTNGIKINNKFVKQSTLQPNDIIKIGRTRLRIIDTKASLPKAMPLSELEENLSWLNKALLTVFLGMACLSYLLLSKFIGTVEEFKLMSALPSELTKLVIISLWPLCFAVFAKVVKKESHLINQINLTLIVTLVFFVLNILQSFLMFNINPGAWFSWLELLIISLILACFIWLSLFIAFHQAPLRRNIVTLVMSTVILAPLVVFGFFNEDEFSNRPNYNLTLLPPAFNISGSMETNMFIDDTEVLFERLDKQKNN
jgi:hypothetical protein